MGRDYTQLAGVTLRLSRIGKEGLSRIGKEGLRRNGRENAAVSNQVVYIDAEASVT